MGRQRGSTEGARASVWDQAHRRLTIGLLLTISITAFEALAVATVLPDIAADLGHGDLSWYGWVFSGFMLANLVGIPAAGAMAGRGRASLPFVAGSAMFAAGLVASGLSVSMPWLVLGRVVQGFGAGALSSVAYAAVAREYDAGGQARMLSLLASAWVIPGLMGPGAAVALATAFGWRSVFLALLPLTIVAALLAVSGLHGPTSSMRGQRDETPLATLRTLRTALGLGVAGVLAMASTAASHAALSAGCAAAAAMIAWPALSAMVPPGTMVARPGAPAALAAKTLVTIAFFGAEAFLPLALTSVRGESLAMAGIALTAGTLSWTAGAWLQERLGPRLGRRMLLGSGLALVALAMIGAAGTLVAARPVMLAVASWCAAGLGIGVAYSATTLAVFEFTPKGEEGSAGAAVQLANVLGTAIGTGVAGAVVDLAARAGWSRLAGIASVDAVMLAVVLLAMAAARRIPPARVPS